MSRRVAIRKAPPLAAAAVAAPVVGMATRMVAGKAAKEAAKGAAKQTFVDKVKDSAAHHAGKQLANAPKDVARASQEKIAEQNKQAQQSMEQRGQQMADKAKAGSQIATGEAMDMAWRMLKSQSLIH
jgi:tyrosyl-tRNA synthetase